ncbi:MAG: sigma-70 family RNA polymerase sigma factor [Saprospiraceae bacterium]
MEFRSDYALSSQLVALSDEQLLAVYREEQRQEAIACLVERYQHLVFGFCLNQLQDREFAKDTAMIVLERVISNAAHTEIRFFKSWLMTILRRELGQVILRLQKSKKMIKPFDESYHSVADDRHWDMEGPSLKDFQLKELNEAILTLSPEQQTCLKLFYFDSKSYAEIIDITGFSMSHVKSMLQNARRNLQIKLKKASEAYDE